MEEDTTNPEAIQGMKLINKNRNWNCECLFVMINPLDSKEDEMDNAGVESFHRPAFCRHLFGNNNFASLQIPTEFLDRIEEVVPDTAILKGPWGKSCTVKVCQKKRGIFLVGGWKKFVADHSLKSGGFLLFTYCGNWCFDVGIFGYNGLEKMKTLDGGEKSEAGPSGVKRKRGRPPKCKVGSLNGQASTSPAPDSGVKNSSGRSRTNWKDLREYFLDLCIQQEATGRTEGGHLSRDSWRKIQIEFKKEKGMNLPLMKLLNRWNYLRRQYVLWFEIITQAKDGQYDPVANKIKWKHKQWEEYIQINPDAKAFRYKSLQYPEKMKILFDFAVQK